MNERGEREAPVCAYCGEHDAWPRHFCLIRMMQAKGLNPAPFPCSYSVEGCERTEQRLAAALARGAAAGGGVDADHA